MMRVDSAQCALMELNSGMRVLVGSGAAAPFSLMDALCERALSLSGVEVCQLLTLGPARAAPRSGDSY